MQLIILKLIIQHLVLVGFRSQPATPIGPTPNTGGTVLQAVYTDSNGQPVYIVNPQPTLIPLQLQQSPLPIAAAGGPQPTTPAQQVHIAHCIQLEISAGIIWCDFFP